MRDFRVQAIVDMVKVLAKKEIGLGRLTNYLWYWLIPNRRRPKANKFFDLRDFGYFRELLLQIGAKDPLWFPRLIEPTTLGIRGWEYALLLEKHSFKKKKVLDVGAGNSRLPRFLAKEGARVTILDMESPLEETDVKLAKGLHFVKGDMTKMKFKDASFNSVICISAIEHVEMDKDGFFGEKKTWQRAKKAIKETVRVLKKDGDFYLTTDFYLNRQRTDNWVYSDDKVHGAFRFKYLGKMLDVIKKEGIIFDSTPEIDHNILIKSKNRANFRGRYFSTFAFKGIKS